MGFKVLPALVCSIVLLLSQPEVSAQWLQSSRSGDIVYFLFDSSLRLERFSIPDRQWLAPIPLPSAYGSATAFALDTNALYVAYGPSVKRYNLNGGEELHLINTTQPIQGIFLDGKLLFLNQAGPYYARVTSINKLTNAAIDEYDCFLDALNGGSIAPAINRIFGRNLGIEPSDVCYLGYKDDGTFIGGGDSPHHGLYPDATRTWVMPGNRVLDDSGTVYSGENLTYFSSLGSALTDITFTDKDIPVVLRGSTLVAYSAALLPISGYPLPVLPRNIFAAGTNILAFSVGCQSYEPDPSGYGASGVPDSASTRRVD